MSGTALSSDDAKHDDTLCPQIQYTAGGHFSTRGQIIKPKDLMPNMLSGRAGRFGAAHPRPKCKSEYTVASFAPTLNRRHNTGADFKIDAGSFWHRKNSRRSRCRVCFGLSPRSVDPVEAGAFSRSVRADFLVLRRFVPRLSLDQRKSGDEILLSDAVGAGGDFAAVPEKPLASRNVGFEILDPVAVGDFACGLLCV